MPAGYRDIADDLRTAIERGTYAPGERIPTERSLGEQYGAHRETVRRALAVLKTEGRIITRRKAGTIVAPVPVRLALARYAGSSPDLGPWETACAAAGVDGRTELVGVDRAPAPGPVAERLGVPADTEVVRRSRVMWADGAPAQVQMAWMPAALVEGSPLAGAEKLAGGTYRAWRAAGHVPASATEEVAARSAGADDRAALALPGGVVLEVWRTTRDRDGRALEVVYVLADAARSALVYDALPIPER